MCSRRLEQAQRACDEQGFAFATDDYRRLLADPAIDVVSICTPNALHKQMALDAIAAGKHVYIDKPVSTDYAGARCIADAAPCRRCKGSGRAEQSLLPRHDEGA